MGHRCQWCGREYDSTIGGASSAYCSRKCEAQANGVRSGGGGHGSETYERAVKTQLEHLDSAGVRNSAEIISSIQSMSANIQGAIHESTREIVASNKQLEATFKEGFNALNGTLSHGFAMLGGQLDQLYMVGREISIALDQIHDVLSNPLLTASRELYRRAVTNFEKGYFEEAIAKIKTANKSRN